MSVSVLAETSGVTLEYSTPVLLKLVEEASSLYPDDVVEEGVAGIAAHRTTMEEVNTFRNAGESRGTRFASVEVAPKAV